MFEMVCIHVLVNMRRHVQAHMAYVVNAGKSINIVPDINSAGKGFIFHLI